MCAAKLVLGKALYEYVASGTDDEQSEYCSFLAFVNFGTISQYLQCVIRVHRVGILLARASSRACKVAEIVRLEKTCTTITLGS